MVGDYTDLINTTLSVTTTRMILRQGVGMLTVSLTVLRGINCTKGQSHTETVQVQCCFTQPATVRTARDGKPVMATSAFTQLLRH